jgi:nucleoside-diphosphate-sugar epimerase
MRLLVVGATGSLGRLAVAEAAQRGHDVTALVRDPARADLPEPVVKVRGDVLDPVSLGPAGRSLAAARSCGCYREFARSMPSVRTARLSATGGWRSLTSGR